MIEGICSFIYNIHYACYSEWCWYVIQMRLECVAGQLAPLIMAPDCQHLRHGGSLLPDEAEDTSQSGMGRSSVGRLEDRNARITAGDVASRS